MSTITRELRRVTELSLRSLDTPVSLGVYLRLKNECWDELATMEVLPRNYLDCPSGVEKYRKDILAASLLRKLATLPTSWNRKQVALEEFYRCEKQCFATNERLKLLDFPLGKLEFAALDILGKCKNLLARIWGRVPNSLSGRFGPGTVFELKGSRHSTLGDKLHVTPHVTTAAYPVFSHTWDGNAFDRRRSLMGLPYVSLVPGNRFTTVPKDGKTDRGICIEPLGNLYCQLGVGSHLKERLAGVGIFVHREVSVDPISALKTRRRPNGQKLHQKLARDGSISGEWATIDLSSASDTVCRELVKRACPDDWHDLLSSLRSPKTLVNGTWHLLSKFSSMGNGYTFELETSIFLGLISSACGLRPGTDIFVYGDDIIIPAKYYQIALSVLRFFGFTPNPKKSFGEGRFRESCGGDYFCGVDVRPFFIKRDPVTPLEWFSLHNGLKRAGLTGGPLSLCISQVPSRYRHFGPPTFGDAVLHGDYTPLTRSKFPHTLWVKGLSPCFRPIPLERWGTSLEDLLPLITGGASPCGFVPQGSVPSGYTPIWLSVS
jgi:hypothetical protein